MSLAALAFGAEAMHPLCKPADGDPLCNMTLERWATLVKQIEELGEIEPDSVDPADCFNVGFLPPPEEGWEPRGECNAVDSKKPGIIEKHGIWSRSDSNFIMVRAPVRDHSSSTHPQPPLTSDDI